jgi:hypothetical protein
VYVCYTKDSVVTEEVGRASTKHLVLTHLRYNMQDYCREMEKSKLVIVEMGRGDAKALGTSDRVIKE